MSEGSGVNARRLLDLGQKIIVARQAGQDVDDLPQAWSDALRKATVAGNVTGEELDKLTDLEYAIWNHPAAEELAVIGTALNEAFERGDVEQTTELYRQRAETLQRHALWYEIANQQIHTN